MPRVGIALGSNLGDRLANLQAARDLLAAIHSGSAPILQGKIYQTAPVGCPSDSPDFFNTALEIEFPGGPEELLEITQGFQHQLGREFSSLRNAPRVIDIDLLYFGDRSIRTDSLELPHPRLSQREFVLKPLADIVPDRILPGQSASISALLQQLPAQESPVQEIFTDW